MEIEPVELEVAVTGGVDEPNLDGIEIDEIDDVEETGDGTAGALLDNPLLGTVFVLVGASKFDIVGECFLFVDPLLDVCVAGVDCLELADDTDVDVLVQVVGILLAAFEAADDDFPLGIVTADPGC